MLNWLFTLATSMTSPQYTPHPLPVPRICTQDWGWNEYGLGTWSLASISPAGTSHTALALSSCIAAAKLVAWASVETSAYTCPGKVLRAKIDLARISGCVGWVALESTLKATSSSDPTCIEGQSQQCSHWRVHSLHIQSPIENPHYSVAALV